MTEYASYLAPRFNLWRWLGFGFANGRMDIVDWRCEDPGPSDWWKPGALVVHVKTKLDWLDRLRILVSGKCEIEVSVRTDCIIKRSEARSNFSVLAPSDPVTPPTPQPRGK